MRHYDHFDCGNPANCTSRARYSIDIFYDDNVVEIDAVQTMYRDVIIAAVKGLHGAVSSIRIWQWDDNGDIVGNWDASDILEGRF